MSRKPLPLSIRGTLVLVALVFGHSLAMAAPDRCQADRTCKELTDEAAKLAELRRYDDALVFYQRAYERVPEPRLLVNIGRCHYRLSRPRKALEFYKAFQKAEPNPDPELGPRVEQWIAEVEKAIVADGGTVTPAPPTSPTSPTSPTPPSLTGPTPAPSTPEPAPPPLVAPPPAPDRRPTRPLWRIGLGVSALGLGGVFIGLGAGALSANGGCAMPSSFEPGRCAVTVEPDGSRTATLIDGITPGAAMLATGSLLVIGGVVLIALPGRRAK